MREAFISILALLAVGVPTECSEVGKDGFNFYKDYLRARSDDAGGEGPLEDRLLYFYRTPLYSSIIPAALEQEYKKRTGNTFKNHMQGAGVHRMYSDHMLSKELFDGVPNKRSSKTALSFLMQGKHPYFADEKSVDALEDIPLN